MARAINAQPYLSLDRYRSLAAIPICLFNGVEDEDEARFGCDHCWSQWEREMVAMALRDAEDALAQRLGYYLGSRFVKDTNQNWVDPMRLNWGHIIGAGIEGLTDVSADVSASDFTISPASITIPTASFPGGEDEIYIIETSSGLQIYPDDVDTVGANYVITVDQCKLIEWDNLENQTTATCITYDALLPAATWLKLADLTIYRQYLDTSDQATVTFPPSCSCYCNGTACEGSDYSACAFVIDEQISKVRVSLADYDTDTESWSCSYAALCSCISLRCSSGICRVEHTATVNYRAGTTSTPGWEQAVMRLAHTYMVLEPCGCALFDMMLNRDRRIPSILTTERINCPLGEMDGAWYAWNWLKTGSHTRAFML